MVVIGFVVDIVTGFVVDVVTGFVVEEGILLSNVKKLLLVKYSKSLSSSIIISSNKSIALGNKNWLKLVSASFFFEIRLSFSRSFEF